MRITSFCWKQRERGKIWPMFWFQEPLKISLPCYFRCPRWPLLLLNTQNAGKLNLFLNSSSLNYVQFLWMLLFSRFEGRDEFLLFFLEMCRFIFVSTPRWKLLNLLHKYQETQPNGSKQLTGLAQRLLVSFQGARSESCLLSVSWVAFSKCPDLIVALKNSDILHLIFFPLEN